MTAIQDILRVGTSAQALALTGKNIELAKKSDKNLGDFVKTATTSIVGIPLLQLQSQLIGGL